MKLDKFVYVGESNGQKMTVNLAKGVFRFTTGALDKKAYEITTPTAAIGVRGTVLDIAVQGASTRVTLVEGQALVCPRRAGDKLRTAGTQLRAGRGRGRRTAMRLRGPEERRPDRAGQKVGQATLTSNAVNFAFNGGGFALLRRSYADRRRLASRRALGRCDGQSVAPASPVMQPAP